MDKIFIYGDISFNSFIHTFLYPLLLGYFGFVYCDERKCDNDAEKLSQNDIDDDNDALASSTEMNNENNSNNKNHTNNSEQTTTSNKFESIVKMQKHKPW